MRPSAPTKGAAEIEKRPSSQRDEGHLCYSAFGGWLCPSFGRFPRGRRRRRGFVRCALALGLRLRGLLLLGLALRLRFPLGLLQTRFALHTLAKRLLSASSSAAARRAGLLGGWLRARGLGLRRAAVGSTLSLLKISSGSASNLSSSMGSWRRGRGFEEIGRQILRDRRIVFPRLAAADDIDIAGGIAANRLRMFLHAAP